MKLDPHNLEKTKNNGFSLIEILAVTIILGIASAIAAPNLMALFSHHKVRNTMVIINGAVKEAQKQAIRQGITCDIDINLDARTITGNPLPCLPEQRNLDDDVRNTDDVTIATNLNPPTISFSAKGNTTTGGTIVVYSGFTNTQRCFVISNGLGITRTGDYTDPLTVPTTPGELAAINAGIDSNNCDSN